MHTTDNVADRQTHSDRGIGPVLGQHCGQHCGGIDQYNTIQWNTIQYNTIFLLIKSSLFQYSVIFSDICGRNVCLCFCRCLFRLVFMFIFVLCLCLFLCFVFVFVSWSFIQWSLISRLFFCLCLRLSLCVHRH